MPVYKGWDEGTTPLHRLLLRLAPRNHQGNLSLSKLVKDIGYSRSALIAWLLNQRLSGGIAQKFIDYDQARPEAERALVTREDFAPFVYKPHD